jgi:hypothetical protein
MSAKGKESTAMTLLINKIQKPYEKFPKASKSFVGDLNLEKLYSKIPSYFIKRGDARKLKLQIKYIAILPATTPIHL